MSENKIIVDDVVADLERVQKFNPEDLIQREKLGEEFSFEEAVDPARRLVALFKKLPASAICEFAPQEMKSIQDQSKSAYALFKAILDFSPREADAEARHGQHIEKLKGSFQQHFSRLFPFISFAVAREVDFNELSEQGRIAVQSLRDDAQTILKDINDVSLQAQKVLEEVREAAAEEGVTRQAKYFSGEADDHQDLSNKWWRYTAIASVIVVLYSISTLFFPLFELFRAETVGESIQIASSKFLVFAVLAYVLFFCARNYLSHKHNYIVNKHRQNALMTYTTLAEAGSTPEARDIILQHAAAAIYAPGDTGYGKKEERGYNSGPFFGVAPRSSLNPQAGGDG